MMTRAHRFMLFAAAPFAGILCWLAFASVQMELDYAYRAEPQMFSLADSAQPVRQGLEAARNGVRQIEQSLEQFVSLYGASTTTANELVYRASLIADKPLRIYDRRITRRLGTPVRHIASENLDLKLFHIVESHYRGYAMKIQLKTDKAMKMVLGKDKLGESETTLQAVKRTGAIAGVNAGGFADDPKTGKRYPLSTTMLNGEYVYGFSPSFKNLFFVGINENGKLIGGEFKKQEELDKLKPVFGASFVPILLKNGVKQTIPKKWLTSPKRAARTVIANYKNDHLLILVTDGADASGKSGATLPELQNKLVELGVVDAYNLDGGGSSSLILEGKVLNRPSDGKLRPLATHFLFFK